jgi:hypothetical protein
VYNTSYLVDTHVRAPVAAAQLHAERDRYIQVHKVVRVQHDAYVHMCTSVVHHREHPVTAKVRFGAVLSAIEM